MSRTRIRALLRHLYPNHVDELSADIHQRTLARRSARQAQSRDAYDPPWSQDDAWLITYPDQFQEPGRRPLEVLAERFRDDLSGMFNGVHVLPFYPWSSDDGYSIIDYESVAPEYGSWADIETLARQGRLMVDAVINHMSASSGWFHRFLAGDPEYAGFFRTVDPSADLSQTVRPRSSPLHHRFVGPAGPVDVWTTFSSDQVDLDFRSPQVFLRVLDVLLSYAARGAAAIRLDAVSYLWKREGSSSINLPETHMTIQLLRACLDLSYPSVLLITETNVPHDENVAYLGRGEREAQAVYQFALPPLALHAFVAGDATVLRRWADDLAAPDPGCTYFNFLASHDGIGLRPAEGLLTGSDVDALIAAVAQGGGRVSMRSGPGGDEPYELNATWFAAVGQGRADELALRRHLASHAVMLAMRGLAGVYVHSLFASPNDLAAVTATSANRSINRTRFTYDPFAAARADAGSPAAVSLAGMRRMLAWRRSSDAFHPDAPQRILDAPPSLFAVERLGTSERARVYVNVTDEIVDLDSGPNWVTFDGDEAPADLGPAGNLWVRHTG